MTLERISITLPRDVLQGADRRARQLDRSRSWVIVEALRTYLAASGSSARESAPAPYGVTAPGLGPQRLAQLESDLRLTPEERIRAAEETARLGTRVGRAPARANRLISFDSYQDYVEWKRTSDIGA